MANYYLQRYDGEQEIVIGDKSVVFKYWDESHQEEISIEYEDIKTVSFAKDNSKYALFVESLVLGIETIVEMAIYEDEIDKMSKCRELCEKAHKIISDNNPTYYYKNETDKNGDFSRLYISLDEKRDKFINIPLVVAIFAVIMFVAAKLS